MTLRIKKILVGAAGGLAAGCIGFGIILAAVTALKEGAGAGLGILAVSPLYLLLYAVVVFKTLLPAGLITGTAAGLAAAFIRGPWSMVLAGLAGAAGGGYWGVRFIDIVLEIRDTPADLAAGGIAGALFFAAAGALVCALISRRPDRGQRPGR